MDGNTVTALVGRAELDRDTVRDAAGRKDDVQMDGHMVAIGMMFKWMGTRWRRC